MRSTYLIMVDVKKFDYNQSATYTIQFTSGTNILLLSEDVSITGQVDEQSYSYYSFPIHYMHEDITISLTVNSGDPDLYISFDPDNNKPSIDHYQVKSANFGSEIITLLWDQELMTYCPNFRLKDPFKENHGCFMYISVYAQYSATYTIRVHPATNVPKYLASGNSIFGSLTIDKYDFYYTYINSSLPIYVTLQTTSGESNLYANIYDINNLPNDKNSWDRPKENNSTLSSINLMLEEINLNPSQISSLCNSICALLVSVYCKSDYCEYDLDITQQEITSMSEGNAKFGTVGTGYHYYSYYCDKDDEELLIIVTPINSCNPNLFVSRGKTSRPTREEYD